MPGWITSLLIAAGILALAIWLTMRTRKWKARAVRTEGRIVEFRRGSDRTRAPVVEFTTSGGETVQHWVNTSSMFDSFAVGKVVPIYYDPEEPQKARIGKFGHLYTLPVILFWVALAAAAVALTKHPEVIARFPILG